MSRGICNASGTAFASNREALAGRSIGERLTVESQAIEEECLHRQFGAQRLDVELAAESAHRDLEWMRAARLSKGDRFAVEDHLTHGQPLSGFDDLRHRGGDIIQAARVDADRVTRLVHLDAGAIHLPLE